MVTCIGSLGYQVGIDFVIVVLQHRNCPRNVNKLLKHGVCFVYVLYLETPTPGWRMSCSK